MKTNLTRCLFLTYSYFVKQPLHVSGVYVAHHQEIVTVYVQQLVRAIRLGGWQLTGSAASLLNVRYNTY
jgi:hypothetical protein